MRLQMNMHPIRAVNRASLCVFHCRFLSVRLPLDRDSRAGKKCHDAKGAIDQLMRRCDMGIVSCFGAAALRSLSQSSNGERC